MTTSHAAGRIGPNAVIRLAEALRSHVGEVRTNEIFAAAHQSRHLAVPPAAMVDEHDVIALHASLRAALDAAGSAQVSAHAGRLTADYLLAHRIPRRVQTLLFALPAPLAARVLVQAIGRHAWTFAGSGQFAATFGGVDAPLQFSIKGCPICRGATSPEPLCDYYAGTFEQLFRRLVKASSRVSERRCQARGAPACVFDVTW